MDPRAAAAAAGVQQNPYLRPENNTNRQPTTATQPNLQAILASSQHPPGVREAIMRLALQNNAAQLATICANAKRCQYFAPPTSLIRMLPSRMRPLSTVPYVSPVLVPGQQFPPPVQNPPNSTALAAASQGVRIPGQPPMTFQGTGGAEANNAPLKKHKGATPREAVSVGMPVPGSIATLPSTAQTAQQTVQAVAAQHKCKHSSRINSPTLMLIPTSPTSAPRPRPD